MPGQAKRRCDVGLNRNHQWGDSYLSAAPSPAGVWQKGMVQEGGREHRVRFCSVVSRKEVE